MLAYAAGRRTVATTRSSPNALLVIIGVHVALAAIVMSAKMEIERHTDGPFIVRSIKERIDDPPPKPIVTKVRQASQTTTTKIDNPQQKVDLGPTTDFVPMPPTKLDPGGMAGGGAAVITKLPPPPPYTAPIRTDARLLTPPSELKPPYPAAKLLNEEEGAVTLKLTIDESGRVIAVDPVGRADPAFLDSARRHVLAHWRFRPASEDGHAIVSTTVVTLRFELDA
jgi:periplasmic protein TonB